MPRKKSKEDALVEIKKNLKSKKLIIGSNKAIKNLKLGKIKKVFLSSNCAENINGNYIASLNCLPFVFQNAIKAAFVIAGIVALILIIYSGIKYILSGGDQKQVETARKTLTYAIIGFLIVLFSFLIVNVISVITGVEFIKFFLFNINTFQ